MAAVIIAVSHYNHFKMLCRDCARYDPKNRKCLDEKVNPLKWEMAVEVANVLGLRTICVFNDHRERLVKARKSKDV
jgi:hypothetical protein